MAAAARGQLRNSRDAWPAGVADFSKIQSSYRVATEIKLRAERRAGEQDEGRGESARPTHRNPRSGDCYPAVYAHTASVGELSAKSLPLLVSAVGIEPTTL
jgi:hypothetical protein